MTDEKCKHNFSSTPRLKLHGRVALKWSLMNCVLDPLAWGQCPVAESCDEGKKPSDYNDRPTDRGHSLPSDWIWTTQSRTALRDCLIRRNASVSVETANTCHFGSMTYRERWAVTTTSYSDKITGWKNRRLGFESRYGTQSTACTPATWPNRPSIHASGRQSNTTRTH
jgi:hypothetical protein